MRYNLRLTQRKDKWYCFGIEGKVILRKEYYNVPVFQSKYITRSFSLKEIRRIYMLFNLHREIYIKADSIKIVPIIKKGG